MARLMGLHITTGPRNGYGQVVPAVPTVCLAVDQYGSLEELDTSQTITIFRSQLWYLPNEEHDAPPGIDKPDFNVMEAANQYESRIRQFIANHPADYYQLTNEIPASSSHWSIVNTLAFELEMAHRLFPDGIRLAFSSPAFDSPQFEDWAEHFPPFLGAATRYEAIYSRHTYGGIGTTYPWLTAPSGLTRAQERIQQEIEHLSGLGIKIPMVLTECGTHAGINKPTDWNRWIQDVETYDRWLQDVASDNGYPVWGFCTFTYGHYRDANIQDASSRIAMYMANNPPAPKPSPHYGGTMECNGLPRTQYKRVYAVIPEDASLEQAIAIFTENWLANRITVGGSYDDAGIGDLADKTAILYGIPQSRRDDFVAWFGEHYPTTRLEFRNLPGNGAGSVFDGLVLGRPVRRPYTFNRGFGVETDYGLHEGVDLTAQGDQRVYAGVYGIVDKVGYSHEGYGRYVRIAFEHNGRTFKRWLAHLQMDVLVDDGQEVSPTTPVGVQGSTGNSTGLHVHDTLQAPAGFGEDGYVIDDAFDPVPFYQDIVADPTEPEAVIGLHGPADPAVTPVVLQEFRNLAPRVIKVLSSVDKNAFGVMVHQNPQADTYIIRAFLSMYENGAPRQVIPEQFVQWTASDVNECIHRIPVDKRVLVKLHNEPNLVEEGMTGSWNSGSEFSEWILSVRDLYRNALERSGVELMFPGLSPVQSSGPWGLEWQLFWNDCHPTARRFDAVGVHAYWSDVFPMDNAVGQVRRHLDYGIVKDIFVTEASRNDRPETQSPSRYALEYVDFAVAIAPFTKGVTYFVVSANNEFFHPESWVVNDQSKGIGAEMRTLIDATR